MKKITIFIFYALMCPAFFTAHAQSGIPLSAQQQIKQSHTLIDKVGEFSDKLLAPNAKQVKQSGQLRSSTASSSPVDLGDGLFLLDGNTDPSSSLVEAKINAAQWSSLISGGSSVLHSVSNLIYTKFNDDFDFIFFVLDKQIDYNIINALGFLGINYGSSNDVQGLGISAYNNAPSWGSAGKLKSAMFFPFQDAILTGPALHELCHNWAAFICPTYGFDNSRYDYGGHWGISNAGGQLGGFKYLRVVQENCDGVQGKTLYQVSFSSNATNADGSFRYPGFGTVANGGNGLPYSDIELYLMGMKSAQDLRNSGFTLDTYSGNSYNSTGDLSAGNGYFYSTTKTSYTIDDIIAMDGARVPDASASQKQFKVLTVVISNETASNNYCPQIIQNVGWFAGEMNDNTHQGLYNFRQATNNVGSLVVDGVKNSLKQSVFIPTLSISPNLLTFAASGGQKTFTITSNTDWTVSSDASWATVSSASGSNNSTVTVATAQNTTGKQRTAIITVSCTGGTSQSIRVIQESATSNIVQIWNLTPTMTAVLNSDGILTVFTSKNAEAMPVVFSAADVPWFDVRNNIHSAIIEDKVTTIGASSFSNCTNLTSVIIPNSVISIGNSAFIWCENLTSITIPNSVETIENGAFSGAGLTSVTIPNSVKSIGYDSFGCRSLFTINVDENNMYFTSNDGVLYNKDQTILFCYPEGKSNISFSIPNSVTEIAGAAFYSNDNLTSITIPNSVVLIGDQNFVNYYSFSAINVDENNMYFTSNDGVLYNKDQTVLYLYPRGKSSISFLIPNSVIKIADFAFTSSFNLSSIVIPNSVNTIGGYAFAGCTNITKVNVNWSTPVPVPDNVFSGVTTSVATLHVPAGAQAFYQVAPVWKDFGTVIERTSTATLSVSPTSLSFAASSEQKTFSVTSNTDWTVSSNASWLTVSPASESNNGIVTVTVAANATASQRTAIITVSDIDGVTSQTIDITQNATQTILYVMENGEVIFESPVSDIDNVTFDNAAPDSALIVQKNDGSPVDKILLNNIQQLSFSDENLSVETPNGIEMYVFENIAKLFFGYTINTGINSPPVQSGLDVLVSITPTGDAAVKSSVPIKSVTLFGVDGKMIFNKHFNGIETQCIVSFQSKPAGVYLFRVETTQDTVVKKVVKP